MSYNFGNQKAVVEISIDEHIKITDGDRSL